MCKCLAYISKWNCVGSTRSQVKVRYRWTSDPEMVEPHAVQLAIFTEWYKDPMDGW